MVVQKQSLNDKQTLCSHTRSGVQGPVVKPLGDAMDTSGMCSTECNNHELKPSNTGQSKRRAGKVTTTGGQSSFDQSCDSISAKCHSGGAEKQEWRAVGEQESLKPTRTEKEAEHSRFTTSDLSASSSSSAHKAYENDFPMLAASGQQSRGAAKRKFPKGNFRRARAVELAKAVNAGNCLGGAASTLGGGGPIVDVCGVNGGATGGSALLQEGGEDLLTKASAPVVEGQPGLKGAGPGVGQKRSNVWVKEKVRALMQQSSSTPSDRSPAKGDSTTSQAAGTTVSTSTTSAGASTAGTKTSWQAMPLFSFHSVVVQCFGSYCTTLVLSCL